MHTDSIFMIGDGHQVCEDYARTGHHNQPDKAYALVSDGCSGSKDTDIGARLLVNVTGQVIAGHPRKSQSPDLLTEVILNADGIRKLMGLPQKSIDATILGITCNHEELRLFGSGDGIIAILTNKNTLVIFELDSPSGYPFFPSYLLDDDRHNQVIKLGGWFVHSYMGKENKEPTYNLPPHYFSKVQLFERCYSVIENEDNELPLIAAIFSDGIKSFTDKDGNKVPWCDIVQELMSFKVLKGEFVKRRMNGFLRGAKKEGWTHHDDLSMAAIKI